MEGVRFFFKCHSALLLHGFLLNFTVEVGEQFASRSPLAKPRTDIPQLLADSGLDVTHTTATEASSSFFADAVVQKIESTHPIFDVMVI